MFLQVIVTFKTGDRIERDSTANQIRLSIMLNVHYAKHAISMVNHQCLETIMCIINYYISNNTIIRNKR